MEFSERPLRFDRQKFVRGWPTSIYIYVYVCMYVCIYVVYFKCFYIQGDGRDRKLLPVVAAGMSEILIENLTTRANILEKL